MTFEFGGNNPEFDSLDTGRLDNGIAGDGNSITSLWGNSGERLILDSVTSAPIDLTSTATSYTNVYTSFSDRSLVNWSDVSYTNLGNYKLEHGFYVAQETTGSGTAYLRLNIAGSGPSPVSGTESTFTDGEFATRRFISTPVDPTNFGKWTPLPEVKVENTGEIRLRGQHTVILTGEIQ